MSLKCSQLRYLGVHIERELSVKTYGLSYYQFEMEI